MGKVVTVNLPDIGEGVVEGEVVEWLKNIGDSLGQDEPVVVVMTDKATVELPAPYPGTLSKQYFKPGEVAIKDKPLYEIEIAGDVSNKSEKQDEKLDTIVVKTPNKSEQKQKKSKPTPKKSSEGNKALATPPVRKLAKDMGIEIHKIPGTGKEGRVTAEDLKSTRQAPAGAVTHFPDDEEKPLIGIQGLMAKKMAESKRTIPHFSYHEKVEARRLVKLRENMKKEGEKEGIQVTFMPFFIRALSLTITKFPMINSCYEEETGKLFIHKQQNIGIAMSTEHGLIVPVLKSIQKSSLNDIIRDFDALKNKALSGKLESKDMKESTITISNYGVLGGGGLWATPIINYPEAAILAVNKIQKQAVAKNDHVEAVDILNISWSFDHRFIDGDLAAKVSSHFSKLIQNPAQLL